MGKAILINTILTLAIGGTLPDDPAATPAWQLWLTFPFVVGCALGWLIIVVEGFGRIVGGAYLAASDAIDDVRRSA